MDYTPYVLAIIASLPGILAIISQVRRDKNDAKKVNIEAIDVAQKSVTVLLEPLNRRIDELEAMGAECKLRIVAFEQIVEHKDVRIRELETIVAGKDRRIAEMQKEIDELRERVNILEKNGNGVYHE